jgi:hypothetical protein
MITPHDLIIDQFAPEVDSEKRLTTWYAQGHTDGLGDRLLMFDNTNAPSWEILRFKSALAHNPRFEAALRQRVERLHTFHHSAFPLVRPIKKLGHEDGLAVVSTYVSGVSLSEALKKPRSAEFAVRVLRDLVPALATLQHHAPGMAHGALNTERIVLTAEGRLMIREHMVGSALESLELPPARLWTEFGIVVPAERGMTPALDDRNDIAQLALVVVSLMAGRRLGPDDYPDRVRELVGAVMFQPLRHWLERALHLTDGGFHSAKDAQDALAELHDVPRRGDDPFEIHQQQLPGTREAAPHEESAPMWAAARGLRTPEQEQAQAASAPMPGLWRRLPPMVRWVALAVGVLAIGEAAFIAQLLYSGSGSTAAVAEKKVVAEPAQPTAPVSVQPTEAAAPPAPAGLPIAVTAAIDPKAVDIRPATAEEKQVLAKTALKLPDPGPAAASPVKTGGFRVTASVEIHVLDGERVLGSSADGPIVVPAGQREFEFVNATLGFRSRRIVDVRPGRITPVQVTVPNGSLNINALPWAAVSIDGAPQGETPLGNISVVPGEHEIIFRHPQLGERREKVIVKSDALTRVSVNLQK